MTTVQRPVTPAGGTSATGRLKWLPGLRTLLSYQPAWLPRDLVAGQEQGCDDEQDDEQSLLHVLSLVY